MKRPTDCDTIVCGISRNLAAKSVPRSTGRPIWKTAFKHDGRDSRSTIVTTGIVIDLITIITSFNAHLNQTVTAARRHAGVQAIIGLVLVSIVASFNIRLH
jgi:hypothetical protein